MESPGIPGKIIQGHCPQTARVNKLIFPQSGLGRWLHSLYDKCQLYGFARSSEAWSGSCIEFVMAKFDRPTLVQ